MLDLIYADLVLHKQWISIRLYKYIKRMLVRNKRTQNMYLTATNEGCDKYVNNKIKIHIHLPKCRNITTQGFNEYS